MDKKFDRPEDMVIYLHTMASTAYPHKDAELRQIADTLSDYIEREKRREYGMEFQQDIQ